MKEFSPICWYKEDGKHIRLPKTRNYVPEFLSVITESVTVTPGRLKSHAGAVKAVFLLA
jgi:hypothetical protein